MKIKFSFISVLKLRENNLKWVQVSSVLTACISMITSGSLQAWPSPSIPKLISNESSIPMTFEETSYFAIIHPLTLIIFCPPLTSVITLIGRKKTLLLASIPQLISWMLIGFGINSTMLYVSRIFEGIGDVLMFIALPVYIAEVTEKTLRGPLIFCIMISFFVGQIAMNAVGYYMSIEKAAFLFSIIPVINVCLFAWMPESPYWLIEQGRLDEAKEQLRVLRWRLNVNEEFADIEEAVQRQLLEKDSFVEIFKSKANRKALAISIIARITQQLSGMNAFLVYLQYIFQEAGGNIPKHISSVISLLLMLVVNIISSKYIDKFGRKPLIVISAAGCSVTLFCETIYFYLKTLTDTSSYGWVALVIMLLFMVMFSIGLSSIPTLLVGELFSASIKSKAVMINNVVFGLLMLVTSKVFHVLAEYVDLYAPFLLFALLTLFCTFLCHYTMIETKNKTLDEIQAEIKKKLSKN